MAKEPKIVERYQPEVYKESWNEEIEAHYNWVRQSVEGQEYPVYLLKFVCPRCQDASEHLLIYTHNDDGGLPIEALRQGTFIEDQLTGSHQYIAIECKCKVQHDTSDQQAVGCGAYFSVRTPAAP